MDFLFCLVDLFIYLLGCAGSWAFRVALVLKHTPAKAGDIETRVQSLSREDSLEEGRATHPTVLAWRIPWTEEPGGLRSAESQSRTRPKQLSTHTLGLIVALETFDLPCRLRTLNCGGWSLAL